MFWKVAGELHKPKYMTRGSKSPRLVLNAAFHSSPSLILTLLYPHRRSRVLFGNEKEWGSVRRFQWSDISFRMIVVNELFKFGLFFWSHGIDLAISRNEVGFEIYGMIPWFS